MDSVASQQNSKIHAGVVTNPDGSNIGDSLPTAGNNPEIVIDSSDPNNVVLTKTIGATDYTKTIATSGSSTTISPWSEV